MGMINRGPSYDYGDGHPWCDYCGLTEEEPDIDEWWGEDENGCIRCPDCAEKTDEELEKEFPECS